MASSSSARHPFDDDDDDQYTSDSDNHHHRHRRLVLLPTELHRHSADENSPDRYVMVPVPTTAATTTIRYVPASPPPPPPPKTKPSPSPVGLFQRLWTDEDEIELLKGFLDYTNRNGWINSSQHHDTSAFYQEIQGKLQLSFNKSQLVEKLRRLKKKYRTVSAKITNSSCISSNSIANEDYFFKTPHDRATYNISCKIWGNNVHSNNNNISTNINSNGSNYYSNINNNSNVSNNISNVVTTAVAPPSYNNTSSGNVVVTASVVTTPPGGRSTSSVEEDIENNHMFGNNSNADCNGGVGVETGFFSGSKKRAREEVATATAIPSISDLVEETVRDCAAPFLKELGRGITSVQCGYGGFDGLNPVPLSYGGMGFVNEVDDVMDKKWRKQQILELEVYSRRLELVQDQIKLVIKELRSKGSS